MKINELQASINADDLDDGVVERVQERLQSLLYYSAPPSHLIEEKAEREAITPRWEVAHKSLTETMKPPREWQITGKAAGWVLGLSVLWLFVAFLIALATEGKHGGVLYPLLPIAAGWIGLVVVDKRETQWKKTQTVQPQTLAQVLPLLEPKSTVESAYCDAVAALLKAKAELGQAATRETLSELKKLLQTGRKSIAQRVEVEQGMNHQKAADIDDEAAHLADRAKAANDFYAREVFQQSLAHLEARRTQVRKMEPFRERLEAQEEAVLQALREAQATLTSTHFAISWAVGTNECAPNAERAALPPSWDDTVYRLRQQTAAVEMAVQEVIGGAKSAAQTVTG